MARFLKRKFRLTVYTILCAAILFTFPAWVNHGMDGRLAIRVIMAEAANQQMISMVGVGEVIRNRGKFQGFSVMKKDLNAFYQAQSAITRFKVHVAWYLSRISNFTMTSTHFENVKDFGPPPWEHEMNKTVHLDDLQFYKKKPRNSNSKGTDGKT